MKPFQLGNDFMNLKLLQTKQIAGTSNETIVEIKLNQFKGLQIFQIFFCDCSL